jgi:uncharacterized 2Fe-2S/4Fe-4S cluster protein (DUF4445 family)
LRSFRVLFQPDGRTVEAAEGQTLLDAARKAGVFINSPCGGTGVCGNCKVQVVSPGDVPVADEDRERLRSGEIEQGLRLACQFRVARDLTCFIPAETGLADQKILVTGEEPSVECEPTVTKRHLRLPAPALGDQRADADRIAEALKSPGAKPGIPLHALRRLPRLLREKDFDVTAVSFDGEVICIEPGDTVSQCLGVAVDVGTTTVVATLMELDTGKPLALVGRTNPQVAYGDDVVSRIAYASSREDGLSLLQSKIVGCLNDMVYELTSRAHVHVSSVYELLAVGNTTMMHLLLGVDPSTIAQAPYVAVYRRGLSIPASQTGIEIAPCGVVTVLPNVAGFVGADTVAMVIATQMYKSKELKLAIDIGTNGEIVLGTGANLTACSTAAGPAFEGARIKFGMRAAPGAVEAVDLDEDVQLQLIDGEKVAGLCGTGLIDAVAELLRVGIIDNTGRILDASRVPSLPPRLRKRIRTGENGNDFVLAWPEETRSGGAVYLTQRDVREVQLAKAAIFAGIQLMKKELNVSDDDISEVLLAGAFGNYIRPQRALRVGLLPNIDPARIRFVGNAASAGAKLALINRSCRTQADSISRQIRYFELAGRSGFQSEFSAAMLFPQS